jgi:hypothetical protein
MFRASFIMMGLNRHQVGLLQRGNEEQIPLYACLADVSWYC